MNKLTEIVKILQGYHGHRRNMEFKFDEPEEVDEKKLPDEVKQFFRDGK